MLSYSYDPDQDTFTIEGVKYRAEVFRILAHPDETKLYRLRRDGDVVVFETVDAQ